MKKIIILFFAILLNFSCEYFGNSESKGVSSLDREYLFIASILSPDSTRQTKTEVFVGRITPNPDPKPAPLGNDNYLNRVILTIRSEYRCNFSGIDNAKVSIISSSGKSVELSRVSEGIYQDKNKELNIFADSAYHLKVEYDGKAYNASTKIPKQIKILSPNTDSVWLSLRRHPALGLIIPQAVLKVSRVQGSHFEYYRHTDSTIYIEDKDPTKPFVRLGHANSHEGYNLSRSKPDSLFDQIIYTPNVKVVEIHDSNYVAIYEPESTFGADTEWWAWYEPRRRMNLKLRSSIQGGDNVAGVFGSLTSDKKNYILVVPKMTSHYEFPPGYVPPTNP